MPGFDTAGGEPDAGEPTEPAVSEAVRATESYEVRDGVVFYDSENPLAWLQSDRTVDLDDAA
jgi:hypothetical protein